MSGPAAVIHSNTFIHVILLLGEEKECRELSQHSAQIKELIHLQELSSDNQSSITCQLHIPTQQAQPPWRNFSN